MLPHIGTSGYAYKEWKGRFYPADLPVSKMLPFYTEHFNAVELNGTFYRMPTAAALQAQTKGVPQDFRFAVKAPQIITHFRRLNGIEAPLAEFLTACQGLRGHLGPLLFQFPPNMKKDADRLAATLTLLPSAIQATFEFRHESWFDDEVLDLLRAHNAALCIAEDDKAKVPPIATATWGYLRLRDTAYTPAALKAWSKKILAMDWSDAWVFFKHEDTATGPAYAQKLQKLLPSAT